MSYLNETPQETLPEPRVVANPIFSQKHNKEIIKIRSRQHEHTSQCDGPAWLTSELIAAESRNCHEVAIGRPLLFPLDRQLDVALLSGKKTGHNNHSIEHLAPTNIEKGVFNSMTSYLRSIRSRAQTSAR
jgi:hypothetical protein